ncbi:MAG: hypothetical protein EOP49_29100, partial [Sphingobacteriales bacterium]
MKQFLSLFSCLLVLIVLLSYRAASPEKGSIKVTTWDAFGYYMYLPALITYGDHKKLDWLAAADEKYKLTGGDGWQAQKVENGNFVFKYLGGVSLLQGPLFLAGDLAARLTGHPRDGFSPPYQYALGYGIILYCFLGLLVLRRVMLYFFNDRITALSILLLCLATNFIRYAAVDNAQSHAYIFVLYCLVLYTTIQWHRAPRAGWALLTGYIIGLATICRPTEAIMLFIPLLWHTHNREAAAEKWSMVGRNRLHLLLAILGGLAGILPQLLYWKSSSGSFIYDVGSKWNFLSPWFRVLVGWEKGWFIYTPVTIAFVAGLFFLKKYPFRNAVLWFCILNLWIIMAWSDWRYGGSYSTRALVQSYPVFCLALGSFLHRSYQGKFRLLILIAGLMLILINLFQTVQYDKTVLHFNDMNRKYYGQIFLNPSPSPEQFSLLDHDVFIADEEAYKKQVLINAPALRPISLNPGSDLTLADQLLRLPECQIAYLKIECSISAPDQLWQNDLSAAIRTGTDSSKGKVRLYRPMIQNTGFNRYAFYLRLPENSPVAGLRIW